MRLIGYFIVGLFLIINSTALCKTKCRTVKVLKGTISPTIVETGGSFTLTCNLSTNVEMSAIKAIVNSGSCQLANYSGSSASFNCIAGTNPGTFSNFCRIAPQLPSNVCSGKAVLIKPALKVKALERSVWLEMTLNESKAFCSGYYYFPEKCDPAKVFCNPNCTPLPENQIQNVVKNLGENFGVNKIYLVYHKQFPISKFIDNFLVWKSYADSLNITLVPSFLLNRYDGDSASAQDPITQNFSDDELLSLISELEKILSPNFSVGIFDTNPDLIRRNYISQLEVIKTNYPGIKLIRVGAQPQEEVGKNLLQNIDGLAADTWTYITACKSNNDWFNDKGPYNFRRSDLSKYETDRTYTRPIPTAWDLIVVGWRYEGNPDTCQFPGDDARYNEPVPKNRNNLVMKDICQNIGKSFDNFSGVSTDLYIIGVTSNVADSIENNFNKALKNSSDYSGKFSVPMNEIKDIFKGASLCP